MVNLAIRKDTARAAGRQDRQDADERLLEYSVRIIKIVEQLPNARVGNHVAGQLLKSGTSPFIENKMRAIKRKTTAI